MPNTPVLSLPYPAAGDPANVPVDMQALALALDGTAGVVPVGSITLWALAVAPAKWLICNGQPVPAEFDKLIALIGANTPDMRDRVPIGASATKALNSLGGAAVLTEAQLPAHGHNPGTLAAANGGPPNTAYGGAHSHHPQDINTNFNVSVGPAVAMYGYFTNQGTGWLKPGVPVGQGNFAFYPLTDVAPDHYHNIPQHGHAITGKSADAGNGQEIWPPHIALNYIIRAG
jgi:microcystin-dependent protein